MLTMMSLLIELFLQGDGGLEGCLGLRKVAQYRLDCQALAKQIDTQSLQLAPRLRVKLRFVLLFSDIIK